MSRLPRAPMGLLACFGALLLAGCPPRQTPPAPPVPPTLPMPEPAPEPPVPPLPVPPPVPLSG